MFASKKRPLLVIALAVVLSFVVVACAAPPTPVPTQAPPTAAAKPTEALKATAAPTVPSAPTSAPAAVTTAPTAAPKATAAPTVPSAPTAEPAADKNGGTVVVGSQTDLASLDPPVASATLDWVSIAQVVYNRLYRFDDKQQIVPDLAEGMPTISQDGKTYDIKLKKGVKFHNGRELAAADVKYSIERNAAPTSQSWNATSPMNNVVGGQDIIGGKATTAAGIKVVDASTVQFSLVNPDAYFLHALTLTTNAIVPKEEVDKWGKDYGFHPVGTGPFMLKEWTPKQKVTLVRNPNYFEKGLPYLDSIVYDIGQAPEVNELRYERGELDLLSDGVPAGEIARVASDPKLGKFFGPAQTLLMYFLGFNVKAPPFDNPKVRQAVAMALNKDRYVGLTSNMTTVAHDWLPSTDFACSIKNAKPIYPYDPAAAKKLLADAGFPNGLSVQVWFRPSRAWISRVPEAMQQDLAAIGVKVELLQLTSSVGTQQIKDGKLGMFANTWGASFPDPYNFGTEIFTSDSTYGQRLRYGNPEVDKVVSQAKQNLDPKSRCDQWLAAQDLFMKDLAAFPLMMINSPELKPMRVEGYVTNPADPGPPYRTMWIKKENRK